MRLAILFLSLLLGLTVTAGLIGCERSGATKEEKAAALAKAMDTAKTFPEVGEKAIEITEAHQKMEIVIPPGIHPQTQANYIQKIGIDWFTAFPDGKKPTKNDMVQVWVWETDKSEDELGFVQIWADAYGKMTMNFHHYKTQNVM